MFKKHVTSQLSAYLQEELAGAERAQVAAHLSQCARCRRELETIQLGISLAESLRLISAPPSLTLVTVAAGRATQLPAPRKITLAWAIPLTALLFICFFGWYWSRRPQPQKIGWEVAGVAGAPSIAGVKLAGQGNLAPGEWLETDNASRAHLKVAEIGYVELAANSRLQLVESKPTEHRLHLRQGKLSAVIVAPPRLFFVDTPSATAVDLGCAYTLEVDAKGDSLLHVTSGWVLIQLQGRETAIPAGMMCATRQGAGIGTPYDADATAQFKEGLARLDFEKPGNPEAELQQLLAAARMSDARTLWHLLTRVEKYSAHNRGQIFDRLAVLVPPPVGVTREKVLAGEQAMLDAWRLLKIR
jgi:anti-sigma factor RsiW